MTNEELKTEYEIYKESVTNPKDFNTFKADMICSCPLSSIEEETMEKKIWGINYLADHDHSNGSITEEHLHVTVNQNDWEEACKLLNQMEAEKEAFIPKFPTGFEINFITTKFQEKGKATLWINPDDMPKNTVPQVGKNFNELTDEIESDKEKKLSEFKSGFQKFDRIELKNLGE